MSVFDQYLRGSFRGVDFSWSDSDGELGRRSQVFVYPKRDLPYVEDMGRSAREFSMDLIIVGSGYMTARDRMIAAIETAGPGLLVHPTRGEMTVSVLRARGPRESTRSGGMAVFSVTFVESGDNRYPSDAADGRHLVTAAAESCTAALAEQAADRISTDGPGFLLDDGAARLQEIAARIRKSINGVPELTRSVAFVQQLSALSSAAADLIRAPIDMVQTISDIMGDMVTLVERPPLAYAALKSFWSYADDEPIPLSTPSRVTQSGNRDALVEVFTSAATISAARVASAGEYDSQQAADAVRIEMAVQIDTVCLASADALYDALVGLRAALIEDLGTRPGLPNIVTVILPSDLPSLVLAHRLYGDAARGDDIVARNRVTHPGFVPAGAALEVLDA